MQKLKIKLPGLFTRIISFIPVINWIALVILGKKCAHKMSIFFGIVWGILTFAVPDIAAYIWIIVMIQYAVMRRTIKKKYMIEKGLTERNKGDKFGDQPANVIEKSIQQRTVSHQINPTMVFSDVVIEGDEEAKQLIPKRSIYSEAKEFNFNTSFGSSSDSKFIRDMKIFEKKSGAKVPFVPFMAYWPTYDSMQRPQKAWYFYWRTEVRNENYIDTDLSYIFIYVYELLSGFGWKDAREGYSKLMAVWVQYRERYPKLDNYLFSWTFDFSLLHNLEYIESDLDGIRMPHQQTLKDILIDKHSEDKPLKLSFVLVDSLCDYSLTGSKFYKDGHQLLIQEAIPRVLALVDALLIRKKNRGILSLYGPNRTEKQSYYMFQSAVCPDANKKIDIMVKAYTSSQTLRSYINEIVRFGENILRAIYGYRGRLRGVTVDEETAVLIEKFLRKEYGFTNESKDDSLIPNTEVKLDFNSINELRNQSDAVRNALEVSEENQEKKELLTDLEEVRALLEVLTEDARKLIDYFVQNKWQCVNDADKITLVNEINKQANKYLACALIVPEQDLLIIEDDYRDELDYIYADQLKSSDGEGREDQLMYSFSAEELSDGMQQVMENLTSVQVEVLQIVLAKESVQEKLEKIAEQVMSMPEILIDEINDIATQYLEDILIDTVGDEPCVLEQYEKELKQAMSQEEKR